MGVVLKGGVSEVRGKMVPVGESNPHALWGHWILSPFSASAAPDPNRQRPE
jgi:hypothetical protein